MNLIEYEEGSYKLTVAPEALLIKAFKIIWTRDKTKTKDKALMDLGFIYHMYDPRSSYYRQFLDEDTRFDEVKSALGYSEKWTPDEDLQKACRVYQNLIQTSSTLALASMKKTLNNLTTFIENFSFEEAEDPVRAAKDISALGANVRKQVDQIEELEKKVFEQIKEDTRMKGGSKNKAIFEDGIQ